MVDRTILISAALLIMAVIVFAAASVLLVNGNTLVGKEEMHPPGDGIAPPNSPGESHPEMGVPGQPGGNPPPQEPCPCGHRISGPPAPEDHQPDPCPCRGPGMNPGPAPGERPETPGWG